MANLRPQDPIHRWFRRTGLDREQPRPRTGTITGA